MRSSYKIGDWSYTLTKIDNYIVQQQNDSTSTIRLFANVGISSLTNDDIDTYTKEFMAEKRLFEYSMPPYKYKIISIEKIKMNKDTKERKREYNVLLESCKRKHKDSETICCNLEKTLFHGTNWNAFEKIIQRGFDPDLNKRSRYGKGTYFATNA